MITTENAALEHVVKIHSKERIQILEELVKDCLRDPQNNVAAEVLAWSAVHNALDPLCLLQLLVVLTQSHEHKSAIGRIVEISWDKNIFPQDCLDYLVSKFEKFDCTEALTAIAKSNYERAESNVEDIPTKIDILAIKKSLAQKQPEAPKPVPVEDRTNSENAALRKRVYLQLMSAMSGEEGAHKVIGLHRTGNTSLLVEVILETCQRSRTYQPMYAKVANRLCVTGDVWKREFERQFCDIYTTKSSDLSPAELRNLGQLYAVLLGDGLSNWTFLKVVKLNPDDSTPSNRIFLQSVLTGLRTELGVQALSKKLWSLERDAVQNIFEADSEFSAAFFESIGLAALARP